MNNLHKIIRAKLKYGFTVEWFNLLYVLFNKKQEITPAVISIDETIKKIVIEKCSASRFGDGEMLLIGNQSIRFQKKSEKLSSRLQEILKSESEKHLICISDAFTNLYRYNRKTRRFWRTHFYLYGHLWDTHLSPGRTYYNTFMTRPYMDFKSKKSSGIWFDLLKEIWDQRDIVIIEGEKSRLGVGNALFNNATSIKRILCPATNSFDKYNDILTEAKGQDNNVLFLIALGPTATVLAYDLFKEGFQAVDVGHVDIEYEWFLMKAKRKVRITSKYVNEVPNGDIVTTSEDEAYKKQIICKIC